MSSSNNFIRLSPINFLETVLQIIEEKQINYPKYVYCFMIIVLYSQYAGYCFSEYETKPLLDPKITFVAIWNEISPPDFMLFLNGIDTLTIVIVTMMHLVLLFEVFYIVSVTILRIYFPDVLKHFSAILKYINVFYQIFFSSFLWVLYIPFTEVHAGIMVIGGNSFLSAHRDLVSYSDKPLIYLIMGPIGIFLTLLTGIVLAYCYISYDFHEKNLLKRGFKLNLVLQLFSRTLLVTFYYLNINNILIIKYGFGHVLGLTALYDFFRYIPFRDDFICIFYGSTTIIYEYVMILFSFWELSDILLENNLFFCWIVPSPLLVVFIIVFYRWKQSSLLRLHPKEVDETLINHVDLFLDMFYESALISESSKNDKLKILGLLHRLFQSPLKGLRLFERSKFQNVLLKTQEIDMDNLIGILSELFQIFLNNPKIKAKQDIYEKVLMKYCTFLSHYRNNPIKAYYELKKLLLMGQRKKDLGHSESMEMVKDKSQTSVIFKIVSNLISEQIERLIAEIFMFKYKILLDTNSEIDYITHKVDLENSHEEKLNLAFLPRTTEICYTTIGEFKKLLKTKILFYENLLKGFQSLEQVKEDSMKFVIQSKKEKELLDIRIQKLSNSNWTENVIILKLESLFHKLIQGNRLSYEEINTKIVEIRSKDLNLINVATRTSYLDSKTIILTISLLKDGGIITNKITHKIASFFGYQLVEFPSNKSIHRLMPVVIGNIHQNMIDKFIKRGPGKIFNTERAIYGINKMHYAFPISLQLTLSFYFQNDYCVSGMLTRIEEDSMDILFSEDGKITSMSESFTDAMPTLKNIDISLLYSKFNVFVFLPDLLELMPKKEEIQTWLKRKENIIEIFSNKILPFYFIEDVDKILRYFKSYNERHNEKSNMKKFYKRFVNSPSCKPIISKKFVSFSVKLEIFPYINHSIVEVFTLKIKTVFSDNDLKDDYMSYTGGQSTSTAQTYMSDSQTFNSSSKNILDEKSPVNKLKNTDLDPLIHDHEDEHNIANIAKILLKQENSEEEEKKNSVKYSRNGSETSNKNQVIEKKDGGREGSVHSSYSGRRTNFGEFLIDDIIKKKKTNTTIQKFMILSIFQIGFFLAINILYHLLVNQQIVILENNFSDVQRELTFINSFYKATLISNIYFLSPMGLLTVQEFENNKKEMKLMMKSGYDMLKNIEADIIESLPQDKIELTIFEAEQARLKKTQNFSFSLVPTIVSTFIYQSLESFDNNMQNKIEFFRGNYLKINDANTKVLNQKFNNFRDMKDNLISLYLYLSFVAISCGVFFQICVLPFLQYYTKYLEKILFLITRLQEKECLVEILKLKTALSKLESANEAYLTYDFEKLEEMKLLDEADNSETKKGTSKKSYKVTYLSSKIFQNKLSLKGVYFYVFLSLGIISSYYAGVFVYLTILKNGLNSSYDIIQYTSTYYNSLSKLDSLKMMILINKEIDPNIMILNDFRDLMSDFNATMSDLKKVNDDDKRFQDLSNNIGSGFGNYKSLMLNDICQITSISNVCENNYFENLKFGLKGYASYLLNKFSQLSFLLYQLNSSNSSNDIHKYLILEGNLNFTLKNFEILEVALNQLLVETDSLVNNNLNTLTNEMILLLLVGGIACSLFWFGINLKRYEYMKQEVNLCKEMLRLIPIPKLTEEATIHLLKALENN